MNEYNKHWLNLVLEIENDLKHHDFFEQIALLSLLNTLVVDYSAEYLEKKYLDYDYDSNNNSTSTKNDSPFKISNITKSQWLSFGFFLLAIILFIVIVHIII
eukprot:Pgem_evm1s16980